MNRSGKPLAMALAMAVLLAGLAGCEKQEGPLEKAGKEVDKAAATVGEKIEKAGEKLQDAAQGDKK